MCHPFSRPTLERLFCGIQFGMDDWGERELSQLAEDGGRLTWRIARRLVCADALRLGTSRAPAKTPARRTMLGDDGNLMQADGNSFPVFILGWTAGAKAAEGCRSPKPGGCSERPGEREASWSAPALWRFGTER
jgi:hypothetical protein